MLPGENELCSATRFPRVMPWGCAAARSAGVRVWAGQLLAGLAAMVALAGGQAGRLRRAYSEPAPGIADIDVLVGPADLSAVNRPTIEIAVFGDSSVAGVGVRHKAEALPVQLAQQLADLSGRQVHVLCYGVSGATTRDVLEQQVARAEAGADVSVLIVGTNDVLRLTPPADLARSTTALFAVLSNKSTPVIFSSLPEFRAMRVLPHPLLAGAITYARVVSAIQRTSAAGNNLVHFVDVRRALGREFLAQGRYMSPDQFHPSAEGYGRIAETLAPAVFAAAVPERLVAPSLEQERSGGHLLVSRARPPKVDAQVPSAGWAGRSRARR